MQLMAPDCKDSPIPKCAARPATTHATSMDVMTLCLMIRCFAPTFALGATLGRLLGTSCIISSNPNPNPKPNLNPNPRHLLHYSL